MKIKKAIIIGTTVVTLILGIGEGTKLYKTCDLPTQVAIGIEDGCLSESEYQARRKIVFEEYQKHPEPLWLYTKDGNDFKNILIREFNKKYSKSEKKFDFSSKDLIYQAWLFIN